MQNAVFHLLRNKNPEEWISRLDIEAFPLTFLLKLPISQGESLAQAGAPQLRGQDPAAVGEEDHEEPQLHVIRQYYQNALKLEVLRN